MGGQKQKCPAEIITDADCANNLALVNTPAQAESAV